MLTTEDKVRLELRVRHMAEATAQSVARRAARRRGRTPSPAKSKKLIFLEPLKPLTAGKVVVKIRHQLPPRLKTQNLHVTIKQADGERVERKVVEISGQDTVSITFDVPGSVVGKSVRVAAFVGSDFEHHLQHIVSGPVKVLAE